MFGKHTAICQLVSPIVNAISPQHITILSGERSPLIFISVRQSSNIFSKLSYFAQFPLPTSSIREGGFQIILLALRAAVEEKETSRD